MTQACVCPECRTWFEAPDGARTARCPACGKRVTVEVARLGGSGSGHEAGGTPDYADYERYNDWRSQHGVRLPPRLGFQFWDLAGAVAFVFIGTGLIVGLRTPTGIVIGIALVGFAVLSGYLTSFWTSYEGLSDWKLLLARGPRYVFQGIGLLIAAVFSVAAC